MGCFNKTGFLSHLPITYGDEIVVFICADQSKSHRRDSCPIGMTGGGLTPICPPFFGKYNDYGGIEEVVDDPNHKYFTEVMGMTVDKFLDVLHDLSGYTIKDFREGIKKYEENPEKENHYHNETKEDFERMLALYTKLFKTKEFRLPKQRNGETNEAYEELKRVYSEMEAYMNNRIENTAIVMTMEHKSVYDKMVEVGREHYFEGWYGQPTSPEDAFDNSLNLYHMIKEEEGEEMHAFNPLKVGVEASFYRGGSDDYTKFFGIKACLHDTVTSGEVDYAIYNDMNRDFADFKEGFVDYAYFLSSMHHMCIMFEASPYHNQEEGYEYIVPVYEKILEVLKGKASRYDNDDED